MKYDLTDLQNRVSRLNVGIQFTFTFLACAFHFSIMEKKKEITGKPTVCIHSQPLISTMIFSMFLKVCYECNMAIFHFSIYAVQPALIVCKLPALIKCGRLQPWKRIGLIKRNN